MADKDAIKQFVQNVLGCSCPEEVFESIESGPVEEGNFRWLRILVGERLLIYISRLDTLDELERELPKLLQAGRQERDHQGYNRFRAVIAATDRLRLEPAAHRLFNHWDDRDDNTFLHLIDRLHIVSFASS